MAKVTSADTSASDAGTMTTLGALFGDIFEGDAGMTPFMVRKRREFTPEVNPDYLFELDEVRLMLMWDSPRVVYNRNLMLTGSTGTGKTDLAFQFAARTGREIFRYSCHERTDFADLLGSLCINKDGSTGFQDGPLAMAMKRGAVFLLDEINAARPGALIGMNGVLDGAPSIMMPDGSVLTRHPDFRVAMTGNAVNRDDTARAFRGTQSMNEAFLDRSFKIEKDYLPELRETKLLHDYLGRMTADPYLNPKQLPVPVGADGLAVALVKFANSIRDQFKAGTCDSTVSTRGLLSFCEMLAMRWSRLDEPEAAMKDLHLCANSTLLGKATGVARLVMSKLFTDGVVEKVKFELPPQGAVSGVGDLELLLVRKSGTSEPMHLLGFFDPRLKSREVSSFNLILDDQVDVVLQKQSRSVAAKALSSSKLLHPMDCIESTVKITCSDQELQAKLEYLATRLALKTATFQGGDRAPKLAAVFETLVQDSVQTEFA